MVAETQTNVVNLQKVQEFNNWMSPKLYYHFCRTHKRKTPVKWGEVYFVDLGVNVGSEENKIRPCVVIQSDSYNYTSPTFVGAIITSSQLTIPDIQISIRGVYAYTDLKNTAKFLNGIIDLGQIRTIAKERIVSNKICMLHAEKSEIEDKMLNIFGLKKVVSKKDHIINSLTGKVEYLSKKQSVENNL